MKKDITPPTTPLATPVHDPNNLSDQLSKLSIDLEGPEASSTPTPNQVKGTTSKGSSGLGKEVLSTIGILVTALVVAFLIIAFVFRSYQVDGPSMETTLQNGDKLIIWKVPRTWASITH